MIKFITSVSFIIGIFTAAPLAALLFEYSPLLGEPMGYVFNKPIYLPWDWVRWFYQQTNPEVQWIFWVSLIPLFSGMIITSILSLIFYRARMHVNNTGSFGTARWATEKDLKRDKLLNYRKIQGIVLAQTKEAKYKKNDLMSKPGKILLDYSKTHTCCIAPTGAGKGIGFVIPTMITWPNSAVILDIKGEIHKLTAGFRSQFSEIKYFNPTVENTNQYNPLDEIRIRTNHEIQDVQNIVTIIMTPNDENKSNADPYWRQSAEMVLNGAILHLKYRDPKPTFHDLLHFISGNSEEWANEMLHYQHTPIGPHKEVARAAQDILARDEKNRSSVITSATAPLYLFSDPLLAKTTSKSDFNIEDLVDSQYPTTLYICIPSSDLTRLNPILRIFFTFIFLKMAARESSLEAIEKQHRLLMLLDEFPQLGRMNSIESNLAFCRGYGIKVAIISQSVNQLNKTYGRDNAILDNIDTKVFFSANDNETASQISKLLGVSTEVRKNISKSGKRMDVVLDNINQTQMEVGRPLLTPGEVLTMSPDECLIIQNGKYPYKGKKVKYYIDNRFMDVLLKAPPLPPLPMIPNEINDEEKIFEGDWENENMDDTISREIDIKDIPEEILKETFDDRDEEFSDINETTKINSNENEISNELEEQEAIQEIYEHDDVRGL